MSLPATLTDAARQVLDEAEPRDKVRLTYDFAQAWRTGEISAIGNTSSPVRPARPARPELMRPGDMPRRSKGGDKGRIALIHAIAHIELNAIDLGWDIITRFAAPDLPNAFYDDWVQVAEDEAKHFDMLVGRLKQLGATYGDLPAHDALWEMAESTSDDILARLALVPMLMEARGLDTTPATVERLERTGDTATAAIMAKIGDDEISHVAAGVRWFEYVCAQRRIAPIPTFQALADARFTSPIRGPFNLQARDRAGMARDYYDPTASTPPQ